MGFFSKLFNSDAKKSDARESEEEKHTASPPAPLPSAPPAISTPPMMLPYLPPEAQPTPTDVFSRPTLAHPEPILEEERPTLVALVIPSVQPAEDSRPPIAKAKSSAPRPPPLPPQAHKSIGPLPPMRAPLPTPIRDEDIEASFTALERTSDRPPRLGTLPTDMNEVRTLFGELATNHMRQVRDFMIELRWGETPTTWLLVCEPAVASLLRAAEAIEYRELALGLVELAKAMGAATQLERAGARMIDGEAREGLLAAHAELERILPETFALASDKSQREAAILHALLSQIPDVHKVTIDKLYAAGLTTLETMFLARTEDLAATTGIAESLAARIVERFRAYKQEIASATIDETRAYERGKIAALIEELRAANVEFDAASSSWTEESRQRKKEVLLERAKTMNAIDLQLARLGEIELVRELERLPFVKKLSRLVDFLHEAEQKLTPTPASSRR